MTTDDLTEALLVQLRRWPDDVQSAGDWASSLPRIYNPSPAKAKTRLDRLARNRLVKRIEHRSPSGKVTAVYYGLAD